MTMPTADTQCFIGQSPAARQIDRDITLAAASDAKVLITGETGSGKDVVARVLHRRSARRHHPLQAINCAGVPDALLESELFGHVRGSFTGAFRDRTGLLEAADRGTAFLDEAGEMSLRMQGMLLRFLETGEVQRVGSERQARRVSVRVVAATNRDLDAHITSGGFREDLYYRLNVVKIHVPPLRARRDDIPLLFAHFVEGFSRSYGLPPRTLTAGAAARLAAYHWPGNVRELKNIVERLIVKAPGTPVSAEDVVLDGCAEPAPARATAAAGPAVDGTVARLMSQLDEGASFWNVVHAPFMQRDLARHHVRAVIRRGLELTSGNYRMLVQLFNMPPADYKRFLSFLSKHECQLPFHAFRGLQSRTAVSAAAGGEPYRHVAGL